MDLVYRQHTRLIYEVFVLLENRHSFFFLKNRLTLLLEIAVRTLDTLYPLTLPYYKMIDLTNSKHRLKLKVYVYNVTKHMLIIKSNILRHPFA